MSDLTRAPPKSTLALWIGALMSLLHSGGAGCG